HYGISNNLVSSYSRIRGGASACDSGRAGIESIGMRSILRTPALAASMFFLMPALAHAQQVSAVRPRQRTIVSRSSTVIELQGLRFKDLNRNGRLDPYEDWRLGPAVRAKDLVGRMTLEDKAGMMMHGSARSPGA